MRYLFILGALLHHIATAKASSLPKNDLWKEDRLVQSLANSSNMMSEAEFNDIIDEIEDAYRPIYEDLGASLSIYRYWSDPTVNAFSAKRGNYWNIWLYGGFARRPEMTPDAYSLVICHEVGHHLGGYPFGTSIWSTEVASEGQSDYYSTLVCPRLIWQDQEETNALYATLLRDPIPRSHCDNAWESTSDRNLCYRTMLASKSLANINALLGNDGEVSWATPDQTEVDATNYSYPPVQCRLDTFTAGATCTKSWDLMLIPGDDQTIRNSLESESISANYTCHQSTGDLNGFRPRCWFKPFLR